MKKLIYILALTLVFGGIVVVSIMLINKETKYKTANEEYKKLNDILIEQVPEEKTQYTEEKTTDKSETENLKADIIFNYDKMVEINREAKGYIYLKDSKISYPIVQHSDNDYYLTHDAAGNKSINGAIFIDCDMPEGLDGMNCIIYGHHMDNDSMFGDIHNFSNKDFALAHQTFVIFNKGEPYEYNVISSFVCSPEDTTVYKKGFSSIDEFVTWGADMIKRSDFSYNEKSVNENDRIVLLSTCTNKGNTRSVTILKRKE